MKKPKTLKAINKLLTKKGMKVLSKELKRVEGKGDIELSSLCNYFENTSMDKITDEVNKYGGKLVDVDLTEQFAFSWPNPEIEGWRHYRAEYGGCNEDCYYEGSIWLPPEANIDYKLFEILQVPEARKEFEAMVEKIHKEKVGDKSNWRTIE